VENLSFPAPYFPFFQWRPTAPYRVAPREAARLVRPSDTGSACNPRIFIYKLLCYDDGNRHSVPSYTNNNNGVRREFQSAYQLSGSKWRAFQLKLNDIRISPHSPLPHYYTQHGEVRYPVSKTEVTAVMFNQSQNRECYGLQIIFKSSNLFPFTADYPSNWPWGTVKPSMTSSLSIKLPSFRGSLLPPSSRTNNNFFCHGATAPSGPKPPHCRGFTITLRHTTLRRPPLDEWPARHRDLYLTTHNTHKRQTSMPLAGFEPTIPGSERPQTHALDRAATGTGNDEYLSRIISETSSIFTNRRYPRGL
jgi:hypothetical protein